MKNNLSIVAILVMANISHAATLFDSNFDGHDVAVDGSYVKDVSGQSLATVSWTTDAAVTSISGLTAISGGGDWVNQNSGLSTGDSLKVNYNLNNGTDQGYSLNFTVNSSFDLDQLSVVSAHSNGTGGAQIYTSTLNYELSGGTLGSTISGSSIETYASTFKAVDFDVSGTTIGAGSYTLQVYMDTFSDPGAYATFDGITLTAVPEPSSFGLIAGAFAFTGIIMRRRRA